MRSHAALLLIILFSFASEVCIATEGWLAFGDMRGYVEPCGCDPEADLGGMQRLAVAFQKERLLAPRLKLYNLGNNLPVENEAPAFKVKTLLEAVESFAPDVSLFNVLEALRIKQIQSKTSNFVLSNVKIKRPPWLKEWREEKNEVVLGYWFDPEHADFVAPLSKDLLNRWRQLKLKKRKRMVLLFAGKESELKRIDDEKIFNLIISANARPLSAVVGPEEKHNEKLLERLGGRVRMVPVGGQGILRGGILTAKVAAPLSEILGSRCQVNPLAKPGLGDECGTTGSNGLFNGAKQVTWLTRAYQLPSPLDQLYKKYEKGASAEFEVLAEARKSDLKESAFAGPEACKTCHKSSYETWSQSAHSHALNTLEEKGKDRDPECVVCHTTGYQDKGGFASAKYSPHLANVTCENCHGARKAHSQNPGEKHAMRGQAKEVCVSCHQGTHTVNFDFDKYWPNIAHGK